MNIETALVYYINDGILIGKSNATLRGYKGTLELFIKHLKMAFTGLILSDLSRKELDSFFIEGIKLKNWSSYTRWTRYRDLNAFFNWCLKKEYIKESPMTDYPKPKLPQQLPKSLNEKEAILLLKIVSSTPYRYHFLKLRNKAVIATLLFTGLRRSELLSLKYNDVDLTNGFITVEHGKGNKRREIPIQEEILKPILFDYREYRDKLFSTSEWFFTGILKSRSKNDGQLSGSTFNELFWMLSKKLGKRVYAHMLRHTFATILLDKTGDIYTLKELLGHSDIKTTTIYLSTTRRKKVEVINKLNLL